MPQERLCATKNRHNYPKNSAQAEFLCFCVFAGKNAVYLANQSCKDGESKALCTGGRKLCATPQSKLSKNSAQAEFLYFCTRLLVKHEFPDAKAKLCATKHGIGGPGTLWHIKIRYLPNAVSQSLRIPLWHLKSHTLPKAPSQSPRIQLTLNSDTDAGSK